MKTPAFQFYPGDFLSSPDVQMMTTQEVGAYCLLLFNAWIITDRPGYLPNNENKLQRLTKLNDKDWNKVKDVVLEKFTVSECGKFRFNKRLITEYDKQEIRRQRLAANGQKGGRPPKQEEKPKEPESKPTDNLQVNSCKPNDNQEQRLSFSSSISNISNNVLEDKPSVLDEISDEVAAKTLDKPMSFEEKYQKFISLYNSLTGSKYIGDPVTKANLEERIKERFTSQHFETAIKNCLADKWHQQNPNVLTPKYITTSEHFQKHLNAKPAPEEEKEVIDYGCGFVKHTDEYLENRWGEKNPDFVQPDYSQPGYRTTLKAV